MSGRHQELLVRRICVGTLNDCKSMRQSQAQERCEKGGGDGWVAALPPCIITMAVVPACSGYIKAMVPFFDMANHDASAQLHHRFVDKDNIFRLTARQKVHPGQQLCIHYGPEPNWRVRIVLSRAPRGFLPPLAT